jgi:hypothetical protein
MIHELRSFVQAKYNSQVHTVFLCIDDTCNRTKLYFLDDFLKGERLYKD